MKSLPSSSARYFSFVLDLWSLFRGSSRKLALIINHEEIRTQRFRVTKCEKILISGETMTPLEVMFIPIFGSAAFVSAVLAFIGGRMSGWVGPIVLLCISAFVCWAGLFLGLDIGYRVWQSTPNPEPAAFSDAGPSGVLIFGWLPGGIFASFWFSISWLIKMFVWKPRVLEAVVMDEGHVAERSAHSVETGNAYQPPAQ